MPQNSASILLKSSYYLLDLEIGAAVMPEGWVHVNQPSRAGKKQITKPRVQLIIAN